MKHLFLITLFFVSLSVWGTDTMHVYNTVALPDSLLIKIKNNVAPQSMWDKYIPSLLAVITTLLSAIVGGAVSYYNSVRVMQRQNIATAQKEKAEKIRGHVAGIISKANIILLNNRKAPTAELDKESWTLRQDILMAIASLSLLIPKKESNKDFDNAITALITELNKQGNSDFGKMSDLSETIATKCIEMLDSENPKE